MSVKAKGIYFPIVVSLCIAISITTGNLFIKLNSCKHFDLGKRDLMSVKGKGI